MNHLLRGVLEIDREKNPANSWHRAPAEKVNVQLVGRPTLGIPKGSEYTPPGGSPSPLSSSPLDGLAWHQKLAAPPGLPGNFCEDHEVEYLRLAFTKLPSLCGREAPELDQARLIRK
jgi:hypothetical protein